MADDRTAEKEKGGIRERTSRAAEAAGDRARDLIDPDKAPQGSIAWLLALAGSYVAAFFKAAGHAIRSATRGRGRGGDGDGER